MTARRVFEVGEQASLELRLPAGRIDLLPGESGRISVELGGRDADRVVVEQIGDTVGLRPDGGPGRGSQIAVSIEVPHGCSLRATVATASLRSRARLGSVRIKSASGDVDLESASTVEVTTASGDMRAEESDRCQISTASGDVYVGRLRSGGELSTASGDIRVVEAGGSVTMKSVSGDMRIDRFHGSDLSLSTVSGDASVSLVPGRRVSVDLTTLSGRIDLPEPPGSPEGPAPGPVMPLRFRSISGGLRVTRAPGDDDRPLSGG